MSVASVNPWHSSSVGPLTIFAMVVCPSVRPSVTSRYCIETTGRIELFGTGASFQLSYIVL